ncbi:hypothetical protein P7C70_g162, partial [Phenoliferia sp. Uapishka_3]
MRVAYLRPVLKRPKELIMAKPSQKRLSLPRLVVNLDSVVHRESLAVAHTKYSTPGIPPIPTTFTDAASHRSSFIPALLSECLEQIRVGKEEVAEEVVNMVVAEVDSTNGSAAFWAPQSRERERESFISWNRHDVLLLKGRIAVVKSATTSGEQYLGNVRTKVKVYLGKDTMIKDGEIIAARRITTLMFSHEIPAHTDNASSNGVCRLKTSVREYEALHQIEHSSLATRVLFPQSIPRIQLSSPAQVIPGLDMSKSAAITGILNETGFSLIQGPPGTGKTRTILKLIEIWRHKRLLVCAPSNAAVDEILRRVLIAPFSSPNLPKKVKGLSVVRIGDPNLVSADVRHTHLEEILLDHHGSLVGRKRRKKLRDNILDRADIIFATLSGCGSGVLDGRVFRTVIVDEAGQAVEPSVFIPLQFRCTHCVLVGDPKQLPPTVVSRAAQRAGYERSIFERIMNLNPGAVHLLSTQYRMHPSISAFPSTKFYDSKIADGPSMETSTSRSWHSDPRFPPYAFIDVSSGNDTLNGTSRLNEVEVSAVLGFYDQIFKLFLSKETSPCSVGIITPYKAQRGALERAFAEKGYAEQVVFNTVDLYYYRDSKVKRKTSSSSRAFELGQEAKSASSATLGEEKFSVSALNLLG